MNAEWKSYEGDFSRGSKHGLGILQFFNGDRLTCYFDSDKVHGTGSFYTALDKSIFEGEWVNNMLIN